MNRPKASTLSAHLFEETKKFFFYPKRLYRTESNLREREKIYDEVASVVPWRATFEVVPGIGELIQEWRTKLDDIYCHELLQAVPEFVDRTRSVVMLSHQKIQAGPHLVYLHEATRTYIAGFFRATIALTRSAIESAFKEKISQRLGGGESELEHLIGFAFNARFIDNSNLNAAHRVRKAGNKVLHEPQSQVSPEQALNTLKDAYSIVVALLPAT